MRRFCLRILLYVAVCSATAGYARAVEFERIPYSAKWLDRETVIFSYDRSFCDSSAFAVNARTLKRSYGVKAPEKFVDFPIKPQGAVNLTFSPDSTKLAFTRDNDIYVVDIASGVETRLTHDGSELILNGYASWVYYEEILGRPSRYRAFWWSPDSQKIGFYRFDNSEVPMFPIYSPAGQDGKLSRTRYPKAGETNPSVRIGIIDLDSPGKVVWADFDDSSDQYFGIPFWGPDNRQFFIAREPRVQNTLDLYAVDVNSGRKKHIYHEDYPTWLDWIEEVIFTDNGLYMARSFESGWQQIYFLSYDGLTFRRLTSGNNWRVHLVRVDEKAGKVWFTATRDSDVKAALYEVDKKGAIRALTDVSMNVSGVQFSPDGKYFTALTSNYTTPYQLRLYKTSSKTTEGTLIADSRGADYDAAKYALPEDVRLTLSCGLTVPGAIVYPKDFDPSKKYPVHMHIYGGPDTPDVKERWVAPDSRNQWWSENGIIHINCDARTSGHNGREGTDQLYRCLDRNEVQDFVEWGRWLQSLPFVQADKIGVEGFSFGGTMTALLLLDHSDVFHYGIAGGGVYDWALYDTHYTERFMDTPQNNPEGYESTKAVGHVANYPCSFDSDDSVMLRLTHGTGDDNVHFQNTLKLVDELQRQGKRFELMIYPDGLHGYRGAQGEHSWNEDKVFWLKYLKGESR